MEERRWITGAEVKGILDFKGIELVLISGSVFTPHDPDYLSPISLNHIFKVQDSWKYECSKGVEAKRDNDLLEDRLLGQHIKKGIQFWENCRGRTPMGVLSPEDLRKAIQEFDTYLYDYTTIKKYREEIIATYREFVSPQDFVLMFKNKLAAHEGFSLKQLATVSMRLRDRFPEANFSDENIAQLIASVFEQNSREQKEAIPSEQFVYELPDNPLDYGKMLVGKGYEPAECISRLKEAFPKLTTEQLGAYARGLEPTPASKAANKKWYQDNKPK